MTPIFHSSDLSDSFMSELNDSIISEFNDSTISNFNDFIISNFKDSIISEFKGSIISDFKDSIISEFNDSIISDFKDSTISEFNDSTISEFKGSIISDFNDSINPFYRHQEPHHSQQRLARTLRCRRPGVLPNFRPRSKPVCLTLPRLDFRLHSYLVFKALPLLEFLFPRLVLSRWQGKGL